jgi:hypothetical protein
VRLLGIEEKEKKAGLPFGSLTVDVLLLQRDDYTILYQG